METSITSQNGNTVAKEYHKFLNDVGDLLPSRDVKKIKRVLSTSEQFSPDEVKGIEDDQDLFEVIEKKGLMGPMDIKFLLQMFDCISNEDVSKKCDEYLRQTQNQSLQGMTSQDDITVANDKESCGIGTASDSDICSINESQVNENTDSVGESRNICEMEAHSSSHTPVKVKVIPVEDAGMDLSDGVLDKIAGHIGYDWEVVITQLGVKSATMDYIKEENPGKTKTQIRKCLIEWKKLRPVKQKKDMSKKFEKLQQVLIDLARNDIVEEISEMFKEEKDLSDSLLWIISEKYGNGWDSFLVQLGIQQSFIDMSQGSKPDIILKSLQFWRDETTVTLEKIGELKSALSDNGHWEVVEYLEAQIKEIKKKNGFQGESCFKEEVASSEEEVASSEEKEDLQTEKESVIVELRDYQAELAEKPLQKHNGIICAGTGSGKTHIAIHVMDDHLEKNPEGMTPSQQADIIWKFRNGKLKGIVATSVVEEGIDIPKCNIVIRYDYIGNEIKAIQAKGRSRAKDGVAHVIANHRKLDREYINIEQQALMKKAIETINEMPEDKLKSQISEYQDDAIEMLIRSKNEETQASQTEEPFSLICSSCGHEIPGHAVRQLGGNNEHVLVDQDIIGDLEEKIFMKKCKFDGREKVAHMFGKCGHKWGAIFKIEKTNVRFYYLNHEGFLVKTKENPLQSFKDIKSSSLKIPEITEIEYTRRLRSYNMQT